MSWPTVTLSEVAEINPRLPKEMRSQSEMDVAFLQMASVSEQGKILDVELRKLEDVVKGFTYFAQGYVIVAKITPCMENGKAAFIDHQIPTEIGFGSTEFHVIRPGPQLDGKYLFHLIWSDKFRFIAEKNMTGTAGQKRVPTSFIQRYKFQLPPLDEQKKIAVILDKADDLHERAIMGSKLNTEIIGSVLFDLMVSQESANWPKMRLDKLFRIVRGGSPRPIKDYITNDQDGINWISIKDGSDGSKYITKTNRKIRREGIKKSRMVYPGDFLLTNSMSFGRPYISAIEGCIHDGWLALSPITEHTNTEFFYHLLGSEIIYHEFLKRAKGAVVKNLNIDLVSNVEVIVPPMEVQKQFIDKVNQIEKTNNIKKIESIGRLKNSLSKELLA